MLKRIIGIAKKNINIQSQALHGDRKQFQKSLHILEDDARGVQVGDIKQAYA